MSLRHLQALPVAALLALTLMAATPAARGQANAIPAQRHILVYGEAEARAVPDRFRIGVALSTLDPDVDVARNKAEAHFRRLIGVLQALKVPDGAVEATTLRIEREERYDSATESQKYAGMRVERDIQVAFEDIETLRAFLARVVTSEEVSVSGIETARSDEGELRSALRGEAIISARAKAERIAKDFGVRLGGLYSVSDVAPEFSYGVREGRWPERLEWQASSENGGQLDRVVVTGTRLRDAESFSAGTTTFKDRIYAVFLLVD
jgi:uncharacterized protein YggE